MQPAPGIAGKPLRRLSGLTCVPSALPGIRLGGGAVPSVAQRSMATMSARRAGPMGRGLLGCRVFPLAA